MPGPRNLPRIPIFEAIQKHDPTTTAVVHSKSGRSFTYGQLILDVAVEKERLLSEAGEHAVEGQPVAFLVENNYDFVGEQEVVLSWDSNNWL